MSVFRKSANVDARSINNIVDANAVIAGELLAAPISFISNGYSSSISITSGDNISAINFTITGTFNGNNIVEVLAGANGNTVSSRTALTVANLTYGTRPDNYYAINDYAAGVTQAQLNRGFITNTVYPFSSIIVCFLDSVNTTASFVEINQS